MQTKTWTIGVGLMLALAACGQTDLERGATGAAMGAGAAAATDEDPVVGAALGAGAGVISDDVRRRVRGYCGASPTTGGRPARRGHRGRAPGGPSRERGEGRCSTRS